MNIQFHDYQIINLIGVSIWLICLLFEEYKQRSVYDYREAAISRYINTDSTLPFGFIWLTIAFLSCLPLHWMYAFAAVGSFIVMATKTFHKNHPRLHSTGAGLAFVVPIFLNVWVSYKAQNMFLLGFALCTVMVGVVVMVLNARMSVKERAVAYTLLPWFVLADVLVY